VTDILKIIFVDNIRDLGRALEVRDQVFVKGQGVDSVLENDGLDSIQDIHNGNAVVILALLDQQPIGTARILISRSEKIIGKVGRVSILEQFRKNGYGNKLMEALHDYSKNNNFDKLILHAQLDVVPFYIKLGYAEEGADFLEADIWHKKMYLKF